MEQEPSTREKILAAGLDEFQSKGFLAASLRNIVKATGVTTGAFYGYFSSKEALFAALVDPGSRNTWAKSPPTASCGWWTTSIKISMPSSC